MNRSNDNASCNVMVNSDRLDIIIGLISSVIDSMKYVPNDSNETGTLYIQFKSKAIWKYINVSKDTWIDFLNADSYGSFYSNYIKGHYVSQKIANPEDQMSIDDCIKIKGKRNHTYLNDLLEMVKKNIHEFIDTKINDDIIEISEIYNKREKQYIKILINDIKEELLKTIEKID